MSRHSTQIHAVAYARSDADGELAAIERINLTMARLKDTYVAEWAPAALDEMEVLVRDLESLRPGLAATFECLYRRAHDMKGQGATFGYGLLTQVGEALCQLTADRESGSESEVGVIRAHLEAARQILDQRLDADGGDMGDRIMTRLAALRRRVAH